MLEVKSFINLEMSLEISIQA